MNSSNGLADPLPGFDDPLGLLRACHGRILAHCDLLEAHLQATDADAARQVHRYFSGAGLLHHRDEEEDLFPRIGRVSLKIAELVHRLRQQHAELDRLWGSIAAGLKAPPATGHDEQFRSAAMQFCALNREHVAIENSDLLPVAGAILSKQELGALGESMAARRGVTYSAL